VVKLAVAARTQPQVGRLIYFIVTAEHTYTQEEVIKQATGAGVRVVTYDEMFKVATTPLGTYVFTDIDRLPHWRARAAARLFRELRAGGARVLNDPARMLSRYGLLRQLFRCGVNGFNAYRVEEGAAPARWPVFLRAEGDHAAPVTDLLHTPEELRSAISQAVDGGAPVSSLLIVEYAAEPVRPGLFRKLTIYRLGEAFVSYCCAHDTQWIIKTGRKGIAPAELYDEELRIVRENPFAATLRPVFDMAGIDYGRLDFGLVGGRPQIYEINSNPHVAFGEDHPFAARMESYRIFKQNYFSALARLDATG
jgi:hypothetical protein